MRLATIAALLGTIFTISVVSESQTTIYWSKDHIYAGADGKEIAIVTPPSSDTTTPTTPTSLAYSSVTATSVYLSWTGSTDSGGSGLAGYKIYRQMGSGASLPVGTVGTGTTSFTDQPLQPSTGYTYTVRAFDNAQNHSSASSSVSVTTSSSSSDTIAPSVPINVQGISLTSPSITVTWDPSTDAGGSGLAGYKVYRGGTLVSGGSLLTSPTFTDTGLTANTAYSYTVTASDNAGNVSSASSALNVSTIRTLIFEDQFNQPDGVGSNCEYVISGVNHSCWDSTIHLLTFRMVFEESIWWAYAATWANQLSQFLLTTDFRATVDLVNNPDGAGIYFWDGYPYASSPAPYYRAYVVGTTLNLSFFSYTYPSWIETVLSTATVSSSIGTVSVAAVASTREIKVSYNGTKLIDFTDTNTAHPNVGHVGMTAYNTAGATTNVFFDNFILED